MSRRHIVEIVGNKQEDNVEIINNKQEDIVEMLVINNDSEGTSIFIKIITSTISMIYIKILEYSAQSLIIRRNLLSIVLRDEYWTQRHG